MIIMRTLLDVADNTGAKRASCISVIGRAGKGHADIGDIITCNIKEATPDSTVKKGEVAKGVIVRTAFPIKRPDGSYLKFDKNAVVLIDLQGNPRGTRIFGPVARELREKNFLKIVSLIATLPTSWSMAAVRMISLFALISARTMLLSTLARLRP